MQDNLNTIVDDLIDHISILKELGERTAEVDTQVVKELTKAHASSTAAQQPTSAPASAPSSQKKREPLTLAFLQNTRPLTAENRNSAMQHLQHEMNHCFDCGLCKHRTAPVVGQGKLASPDIMFIGPAPDSGDDKAGVAFSGPAGDLLSKMIEAMGLKREDLFLTNTCKCCTPNNRAPTLNEMEACSRFLEEQIKVIRPKVIVVLGEHANKGLFHNQRTAVQPQGTWTQYHGIPVMPTFHPKYILRFSSDAGQQKELKRSVWTALQGVMQVLKK